MCGRGFLNGWVGDRVKEEIFGVFKAQVENENGKKVVDFRAERRLCTANMYFKGNNIDKYTMVDRN